MEERDADDPMNEVQPVGGFSGGWIKKVDDGGMGEEATEGGVAKRNIELTDGAASTDKLPKVDADDPKTESQPVPPNPGGYIKEIAD
jgi:hypothetical protein